MAFQGGFELTKTLATGFSGNMKEAYIFSKAPRKVLVDNDGKGALLEKIVFFGYCHVISISKVVKTCDG